MLMWSRLPSTRSDHDQLARLRKPLPRLARIPVPPEPYLVLSAPQGASASPVAGAVEPRVTKLPEKLRSNRYLWLESRQIGHDCTAAVADLDRNFRLPGEIWARVGNKPASTQGCRVVRQSRRYLPLAFDCTGGYVGDGAVVRRFAANGLHEPVIPITKSARGMLLALITALSSSVVRA